MQEKLPYKIEHCKASTISFYKEINNKMVYVTINVQSLPSNIPKIKDKYSVSEYLKNLSEVIDELLPNEEESQPLDQ